MTKPVIGITSWFDPEEEKYWSKRYYARAIWKTGGIPFFLPHIKEMTNDLEELIGSMDGLLLSGGTDLDPNSFGQEPKFDLNEIDPIRDRLELGLARLALEDEFPVLAICRGIQVLNVAAGGNLYQDLDNQRENAINHHQDAPRWHPTHEVRIDRGSTLYEVVGKEKIRVNSLHHQNVRQVGRGFEVTARSSDGLIEAVEHREAGFQLGVQWHPEAMVDNDENSFRIFSRFIEASS
jgi:putative glutamine amidotransferase